MKQNISWLHKLNIGYIKILLKENREQKKKK